MRCVSFQIVLGPVEIVAEIDSTNRALVERARAGAAEGLVLVADHQTAGRGRLDRRWEAAPGTSLLVSVLLRPDLAPDRTHLVTVAAGLAARDACADVAGVAVSLKWPNDVVVERPDGTAKLAGLLAEALVAGGRAEAVVVGMGLNLRTSDSLPPGGVALDRLAGRDVSRDDLLHSWVAALSTRYDSLSGAAGASGLTDDFRAACSTLGREVRVEVGNGVLTGRAVDVTEEGHLVLETPAGRRAVSVGDVIHLRPA